MAAPHGLLRQVFERWPARAPDRRPCHPRPRACWRFLRCGPSPGIPRACIPAARRGRVMRAPARGQSATTRHAKCPGRPACRRRKRRRRRSATCQMSGAAGHACRQDRGPLRRARAWQGMRAALHALPWFASCSRGSAARTGGRVGPALCTLRQAGAGWRRVWEGGGGGEEGRCRVRHGAPRARENEKGVMIRLPATA